MSARRASGVSAGRDRGCIKNICVSVSEDRHRSAYLSIYLSIYTPCPYPRLTPLAGLVGKRRLNTRMGEHTHPHTRHRPAYLSIYVCIHIYTPCPLPALTPFARLAGKRLLNTKMWNTHIHTPDTARHIDL